MFPSGHKIVPQYAVNMKLQCDIVAKVARRGIKPCLAEALFLFRTVISHMLGQLMGVLCM